MIIPFSKVGDYCPSSRNGKRVHPSTAWRWAKSGCRAIDGTRVLLESIRIGATTYTSVEALERFAARLSAQPTPRPRVRQDLIDRRLAAFGL
jgi:hypothetical protein